MHEAVAHQTSAEVTEPTCVAVLRRGYKLGDRLLRVPLVAVAEPAPEPADPTQDPTQDPTVTPDVAGRVDDDETTQ